MAPSTAAPHPRPNSAAVEHSYRAVLEICVHCLCRFSRLLSAVAIQLTCYVVKLSNDPFFVEGVRDIVGPYLNQPDQAVVLCVTEKQQIQALDRTQPLLPMGLGSVVGVTATLPLGLRTVTLVPAELCDMPLRSGHPDQAADGKEQIDGDAHL